MAFEGLVRPIMSFFHVPGPRPKKRPGTMLVRRSCQFIHFYLPVPQGVCFVVREERFLFYRASRGSFMAREGIMVYERGLKRVTVHLRVLWCT